MKQRHSAFAKAGTALAISALIAGCASTTMAPDYQRPPSPAPGAIPFSEASGLPARLADWRAFATDPALAALIRTALQNNRDLRIAALNVERARAGLRVERSGLLPSVSAEGDYFRQRIGPDASIGIPGAAGSARQDPIVIEQFSATGAVSAYELDLFGRVRSLTRSALESWLATEEAQRSAEIALIAEVSGAYFRLVADRELLAIARDTLNSQLESRDLIARRVEDGIGTDLDLQRAQTLVERARADEAALMARIAQDENALVLLAGSPLPEGLPIAGALGAVQLPEPAPGGLTSALLLNRPDVLAAERTLKAANANIGAARAAFFPRILLTASAGSTSSELAGLFSGGAGVWNFAPSISLPIFTGGRNRAQLAGAKIDREIAVNRYELAVQSAFRDVANALATRATIDERLNATQRLADSASRVHDLATARFENGVDDYLDVLDAQRSDYAARSELVGVKLAALTNAVDIYRALGGYPVVSQ